ncbi:MAG: glycosyltransferase [Butyrivibrio sp.]|nr:glycosyltransferase [Butyrivibrio sp.]
MQRLKNYHVPEIAESAQNEKISVIVACYNVEKYIERCIRSIMNQTYKNMEIIIVDDGSKDQSGKIADTLAKEDDRIKVIHQLNLGRGGARNTGIEASTGEYVSFVDGDDSINPKMLEALLSGMYEFKADVSVCRYKETPVSDGKIKEKDIEVKDASAYVLNKNELLTFYIEENEDIVIQNAVWNKLWKREAIGRLRMPEHKRYEDMVFTTKVLAKAEKAFYTDMPLYNYTVDRKESIMNRGVTKAILTDQIPAYMDKDAFLQSIGRSDLMYTHKYFTYKKLLLLYTEARRAAEKMKDQTEAKKQQDIQRALGNVISQCKNDFDKIYSCSVCDKHQKLRMSLFLKNPVLYNTFMDVNDGFVLPLRKRIRDTKRARVVK